MVQPSEPSFFTCEDWEVEVWKRREKYEQKRREKRRKVFVFWMVIVGLVLFFFGTLCHGQGTFDAWKPKQIEASSQLCCEGGACLKIAGQPVDAHGYGWYKVKQIRGTGERGVLGEVVARAEHLQFMVQDKGGSCHETVHVLNSQIRRALARRTQQQAAYVPGGYALLLPDCGIAAISFVSSEGKRLIPTAPWGDGTPQDALVIVDEYSAYICGTAARVEHGYRPVQIVNGQVVREGFGESNPGGSYDRAKMVERELKRLRNELARRGYNYVHRIDELLAYGGAYLANLERGMNR